MFWDKAEERFWKWFVKHEDELLHFERDQERVFDRLAKELGRVHGSLTFEFGPPQAKREFVVSAAGIKAAFPAVLVLTKAAPVLDRWQIVAFRPRRFPLNNVQLGGCKADAEEVQVSLLDDGTLIGLHVFIPGFEDGDMRWAQIGYLLLDEALGEYDVETRVGFIEMHGLDAEIEGDRYPVTELAPLFDGLVARLAGLSGLPS